MVKSLGREGEETARFGAKARQLRDVSVRAGQVRAVFDPLLETLPNLGVLAVLLVGVHRVSTGAVPPGKRKARQGRALVQRGRREVPRCGEDSAGRVLQAGDRRHRRVMTTAPGHPPAIGAASPLDKHYM